MAYLWFRYKHFVVTFFFVIAAYFFLTELIIFFEQFNVSSQGQQSEILQLSWGEFHRWALILILIGNDEGIFPVSYIGPFIIVILNYLGWLSIAVSVLFEILLNRKIKKRMEGKIKSTFKNHFVICGWNDQTIQFIESTSLAMKDFSNLNNSMVIVHEDLSSEISNNSGLKNLISQGKINYVKGKIRDNEVLKQVNIEYANSVVLLADDNSIESDERTLLRALAISRYCNEKNNSSDDSIYMIAEINDPSFRISLLNSHVNEVICSKSVTNGILTQSMIFHGVSNVISDLIRFSDDTNEFYVLKIKDHKSLVGLNYTELHKELRKYKILLLGIKRTFLDKDQQEIIDLKKIDSLLAIDKEITRQYIINPMNDVEEEYRTKNWDELVVLTFNGKIISSIP